MGCYREDNLQASLSYENQAVRLDISEVDIEGDITPIKSIIFPCFREPIEMESNKIAQFNDILYEFFKSILNRKYPMAPQLQLMEILCREDVIKKAFLRACQTSRVCPCPIFYSFGCIEVVLGEKKLRDTKVVRNLFYALAPIIKPYILTCIIEDSEPFARPPLPIGKFSHEDRE